jgi:hypothetical protein
VNRTDAKQASLSYEKNQTTFASASLPYYQAMAGIYPRAPHINVFYFFSPENNFTSVRQATPYLPNRLNSKARCPICQIRICLETGTPEHRGKIP